MDASLNFEGGIHFVFAEQDVLYLGIVSMAGDDADAAFNVAAKSSGGVLQRTILEYFSSISCAPRNSSSETVKVEVTMPTEQDPAVSAGTWRHQVDIVSDTFRSGAFPLQQENGKRQRRVACRFYRF